MAPIQTFKVFLDQLDKSFFPGQTLSGNVILETPSKKERVSITVYFVGLSRVKFSSKDKIDHSAIKYHFNENEIIFGEDGGKNVEAGSHRYPFSFTLSENLPSTHSTSFQVPQKGLDQSGEIIYYVEAVLNKQSKKLSNKTHSSKTIFTVTAILDLNEEDSTLSYPVELTQPLTEWSFCCFHSTPGVATLELSKTGYATGELLSFRIHQDTLITGVTFEILQKITLIAKTDTCIIKKSFCNISTEAGDRPKKNWAKTVHIPVDMIPTQTNSAHLILVTYEIRVNVDVYTNLVQPITIGNIPIQQQFQNEFVPQANSSRPELQQKYEMWLASKGKNATNNPEGSSASNQVEPHSNRRRRSSLQQKYEKWLSDKENTAKGGQNDQSMSSAVEN